MASAALAAFKFDKSRIGILLREEPFPTLGEIAYAVASDIKWAPHRMELSEYLLWHHQEYYPFLWDVLDKEFDNRPDYRLWRRVARPNYPSIYSAQWPEVLLTAIEGLENHDDVIVWGVLAVLSGFLTSKRLRELFPDEKSREEIATRTKHRIIERLAPVRGGEAVCALIKALTWSAIQQAEHQCGRMFTVDDASEYYDRLEKSLGEADPSWLPGSILRVGEAIKRGRVIAPYDQVDLQIRVAEVLSKSRAVARYAVRFFDKPADQLLKRAALLAFSSWRFTRSLRIGEDKFRRDNPTNSPKYDIEELRREEMIALKRFCMALRDAAYYLDATFAAWLLLTLLPNELLDDDEFRSVGNELAGALRNAGLAVPKRFWAPKEDNKRRSARRSKSRIPDNDPFLQRLEWEKKTDARWQQILRLDGSVDTNPFGALGRVVDRRRELAGDTDGLRAAFGLCKRYVRLRDAAQLAACFQLEKDELMDLAHSIKRALQLNLIAVDHDTHAAWRDVLRDSWTRLPENATLSEDSILTLHEVLGGRYPSIVRSAGLNASQTLALQLYNQLDDEAISGLVDIGPHAFRRGPATVNIERLQALLNGMSEPSSLGSPVCISAIRLSDDSISLLAVAADRVIAKRINLPGINSAPAEVRSTYSLWLRRNGPETKNLSIPWHSRLIEFIDAVLDLVNRLDPSCRWVALAIEPDMASLPWCNLVSSRAPGLMASLIPSLSWFATAIKHTQTVTQTVTLRTSRAEDLSGLQTRLRTDEALLQRLIGSCGIVLGHGRTTDRGIPSIAIEESTMAVKEWLNLAARRVLIVHSCHGGRVSNSFPSDLGGLPGLALSIGCRLLIAPVTEVPTTAAWALHDEVTRNDGPSEIGFRYLAATRRNAAVALYNVYGFPNERMNSETC